jgi:ABC-2 type transport system permease protein
MLRTLRAMPTILRVGMAEAIAYRAEMFVWVLSTTMPLIMMMLWTAVAEYAPVVAGNGRAYGTRGFVAYFLAVFIVRQLVSSWAAWEINFEVRQGTLAMRLLRPIHPIVSYAAGNVAALPMRFVIVVPIVGIVFAAGVQDRFPHDAATWALWALSMLLGWMLTFLANVAIGALSLFMEQSIKVMDVWLASFFVFSGYLFPPDIFPGWLKTVGDWLPFRYQLGVPVELLTTPHVLGEAINLVARQAAWAGVMGVLCLSLWTFGVRRFQAFGG